MNFSGKKFDQLWKSLSEETRQEIKAKALWEHMSLAAVMMDWWPILWQAITEPEKEQHHERPRLTKIP